MDAILTLLAGTFYGLIIGLIPAAGATTGLVALFGFIGFFGFDPYLGVVFCMAVVAASTTGDTYSGILLGIPGANSAAATMVDGHPLAQQGKATYALTSAITTSTVNGLLWGTLTFALLPWYAKLIMYFGIPELWAFVMLSLACVGFVSNKFWVRSLIAIAVGIFIGLIGVDPTTNVDRFTFNWDYLADSIQLMPFVAGLFAFPEILDGWRKGKSIAPIGEDLHSKQTWEGIKAVWKYKWDALRGGAIGAFIGFLPGVGGAMGDWMAYGSTVATHPEEEFGKGNIRGVIGPEGANNSQKATSMIPTVLFGIPGASFAAVLMALFMYLGFELGVPDLANDTRFFDSLTFGFMWATVIVGIVCILFNRYIALITYVPYKYYFPLLVVFIVWACVQYTGGWEDYAILGICTLLGVLAKKYKFSRPALLMAFILADKVEALTIQLTRLYTFDKLLDRPLFLILVLCIIVLFIWAVARRSKLEYA
jgi:TctA family transporter